MIPAHGRRHLTLLVGFCVAALLLVGCDKQDPPTQPGTTDTSASPGDIASGRGPGTPAAANVCIVCKGKIAEGDAVAVTYKDGKFKCCGKECAAKFKEEAGKYVPMSPPTGG